MNPQPFGWRTSHTTWVQDYFSLILNFNQVWCQKNTHTRLNRYLPLADAFGIYLFILSEWCIFGWVFLWDIYAPGPAHGVCNKCNGTGPNNFWGLQFVSLVLCTLKRHYFFFVVYYKSTHEHNTGRLNSLTVYLLRSTYFYIPCH